MAGKRRGPRVEAQGANREEPIRVQKPLVRALDFAGFSWFGGILEQLQN